MKKLKELLPKYFTILTSDDPQFPTDNVEDFSSLLLWLQGDDGRRRCNWSLVYGSWNGTEEEGVMIEKNLTEKETQDFFERFGQEAIATQDGILYRDGSYEPRNEATDMISDSLVDNYTSWNHIKFRMGLFKRIYKL